VADAALGALLLLVLLAAVAGGGNSTRAALSRGARAVMLTMMRSTLQGELDDVKSDYTFGEA
jgi:hypothetical protein